MACKKRLAAKLNEYMEPIRERREHFAGKPQQVQEILQDGQQKASRKAAETLALVRDAMGM